MNRVSETSHMNELNSGREMELRAGPSRFGVTQTSVAGRDSDGAAHRPYLAMETRLHSTNPWPIAIVAYFTLFALAITLFVPWAVRQKMDLVRSDYYEQEILFQQQIDKMGRTHVRGTQPRIEFDRPDAFIVVKFSQVEMTARPTGTIHFYRPSDARLDHTIPLAIDAEGVQRIDAQKLSPGLWKLQVSWNTAGTEYYFEQALVIGKEKRMGKLGG